MNTQSRPSSSVARRRLVAPLLAAAMIFTGCSSDGDDDKDETPTTISGTTVDDTSTSTDESDDETTSSEMPESTDRTTEGADDDIVANPPAKTWQEALDAARDRFDGGVTKIELEQRRAGSLEYKIELISETTEFTIRFDADTLEELSTEEEDLDDDADEERRKVFEPSEMISLEEAASIARDALDGVIEEWKLEGDDDGRVEYEFDIVPPGETGDREVELDARTGEVLDVG